MNKGLKDHEISQLVNDIRDSIKELYPHQCLRQLISTAATKSLENMDRRIDINRHKSRRSYSK